MEKVGTWSARPLTWDLVAPVSDRSATVVVTGAGHGLGAAIADAGAPPPGGPSACSTATATPPARTAAALGAGAVALTADTTDERGVEAALDRLAEATGRPAPDAVVCNAGIVRFGPLLDVSLDDWRAVVDVNLTGTFVTARAVARRLVAAGRPGSIVTVTSMNGVAPGPNAGAYGATKAGVARLTQQMALEWGAHGIRANAVAPGLIDAGMSEPDLRRPRHPAPSRRAGCRWVGSDRGATWPTSCSSCCRTAAAYVTGTELLVDGGVTMSVIDTLPRPEAVDSVGRRRRRRRDAE